MEKLSVKGTLIEALGIEFVSIEKGKVIATMPVDERTRQPLGYLHGGASVALAETVASYGTVALIDAETHICFGLEINANHIKAKREGIVTATASTIHQGRTTMVWEINITDEDQKLICVSRCTVAVVEKKQ
ncbi:hotdog fold thioesterase [Jeotgalibacillus proteolyticus]|uniref:Esterase n=1 Tax=Jeotgalibacillus proteolyticus TaxID=2082395 RepID=A0A2S5GBS8_9BACL|nr:PaaI family thioesterase [Jeotgalibacillus proteolyticus]PPA70497.1 esterase [Jeotgalibacillus proteolyticus]